VTLRRTLFLFLGVFTLYWITLAPTFLWSDSAKLGIFAYQKQFIAAGFGAHPGHSLLGYLFSFLPLPFAYTQNLMSAFFGAFAIALLFLIMRMRSPDDIAMISCLALAVSHLFWHYSVINETYSLLIFFLALFLLLVLKADENPRWLYGASLTLGFAFANHGAILLALPGCILLLWGRGILKYFANFRVFPLILLFVTGSCQVLVLPLFFSHGAQGSVMKDLFRNFEIFWQGLSKLPREAMRYPLYLLYEFPTISGFLGVYGCFLLWKRNRRYAVATLLLWLVFVLFSLQYFFQRQFAFLIPSFFVFALWIPEGLEVEITWCEKFVSRKTALTAAFVFLCVLPGCLYYSAYRIAEAKQWRLSAVRELPYRDNLRYFLFPAKHFERGAESYANDSFRQAAKDAVILSDFNPGMALRYSQQVLGKRADLDVVILDSWLFSAGDPTEKILRFLRVETGQNKTIYLADSWEPYYKVSAIRKEFDLRRQGGPLWQVFSKR